MSIEPNTREELFMAKAAGQDVNTPEPSSRREFFLKAIADNASSSSQSTLAWRPTVDSSGNISWELSENSTAPITQNIKGEKGDMGVGISTIELNYIDENVYHYNVVLTDGTKMPFNVTNGVDGKDGNTPVKGTDYFTEEDKQEIINAVLEALQTTEE